MSAVLDEALRLGELGLNVFPVVQAGKAPTRPGWQTAATRDAAAIAAMFSDGRLNVGVATGKASSVWVLDVDVKHDAQGFASLESLEAEHGALPATWCSHTPSGGLHLWFYYPRGGRRIGNRVGVKHGLDVRGIGGFVVVPPSRVCGAAYAWKSRPSADGPAEAPDWLLDLVAPEPKPQSKLSAPVGCICGSDLRRLNRYAARALEGELERVETARPGGRNRSLFLAACSLGSLVGAGHLPLAIVEAGLLIAAEVCGLVQSDGLRSVKATIASGLKRGIATPREVRP